MKKLLALLFAVSAGSSAGFAQVPMQVRQVSDVSLSATGAQNLEDASILADKMFSGKAFSGNAAPAPVQFGQQQPAGHPGAGPAHPPAVQPAHPGGNTHQGGSNNPGNHNGNNHPGVGNHHQPPPPSHHNHHHQTTVYTYGPVGAIATGISLIIAGGLFPIVLGAALVVLGAAVLYYDLKGAFK